MPEKIQKFAHFIAFFGIFFSVVFVPYLRRICVVFASCYIFACFMPFPNVFLLVFQAKFRSELKSFEKYFFVLLLSVKCI